MTAEVVAMVDVLQDKREAIAELCARYGVARLDVFGSALRDDFRPGESDVDLLVEFGPMDGYAKAVAYFDLLDELHELLGVEVDLVMTGAVKNRYIARDIERTRPAGPAYHARRWSRQPRRRSAGTRARAGCGSRR